MKRKYVRVSDQSDDGRPASRLARSVAVNFQINAWPLLAGMTLSIALIGGCSPEEAPPAGNAPAASTTTEPGSAPAPAAATGETPPPVEAPAANAEPKKEEAASAPAPAEPKKDEAAPAEPKKDGGS
jgi:hypothetical protein